MRSATLAVVALCTSLAIGASIPGLPACAGTCVTSFGSCSLLDVKCICSDSSLLANLACCVGQTCSLTDQNATIAFADALCAGQGVTNLPAAATCAPGASGAPATTGAASTTGSTTVPASLSSAIASASSAAASASTSATAAQASTSASLSSAVQSASASNAAASSSVVSQQSSAAAAASASASHSSGAKSVGIQDLGLGMVVAGLIAAL